MRSLCAQGCSLCAQGRSLCALGRSLCAQGRSLSAQGRSLCAACAHKGAACAQKGAACARKGAACAQINSIQVNFCRRCSPMSSAVRRIDALLRLGATWKLERRRPTCGIELEGGVSLRGFCTFFRSYRGVVGSIRPAQMVAHTPQC